MAPQKENLTSEKERNEPLSIQIKGFRALLIALATASVVAQPVWQLYYKDQDSARALEGLKAEKNAESAMSMARAAITEVTNLSSKYGELKSENMSLKEKLDVLSAEYTKLLEKYKEIEAAYAKALEEKKALEARIDQFFQKQTELHQK
jgi:predicted nuclease with TOPRIM domain